MESFFLINLKLKWLMKVNLIKFLLEFVNNHLMLFTFYCKTKNRRSTFLKTNLYIKIHLEYEMNLLSSESLKYSSNGYQNLWRNFWENQAMMFVKFNSRLIVIVHFDSIYRLQFNQNHWNSTTFTRLLSACEKLLYIKEK